MRKTTPAEFVEFDRFMKTMARMIGISRRQLDRMLFQGKRPVTHPRGVERRAPARRSRAALSL